MVNLPSDLQQVVINDPSSISANRDLLNTASGGPEINISIVENVASVVQESSSSITDLIFGGFNQILSDLWGWLLYNLFSPGLIVIYAILFFVIQYYLIRFYFHVGTVIYNTIVLIRSAIKSGKQFGATAKEIFGINNSN